MSQSLSGWDGVFHILLTAPENAVKVEVAIPFRVGWGFSPEASGTRNPSTENSRNPFQGGMGFFTPFPLARVRVKDFVAIPFRVGWGFSLS